MVVEVEIETTDQTNQEEQLEEDQPQKKKQVENKKNEKQSKKDEPTPPIPYPQRLKKNKLDKKFTNFMELFKKLILIFLSRMH